MIPSKISPYNSMSSIWSWWWDQPNLIALVSLSPLNLPPIAHVTSLGLAPSHDCSLGMFYSPGISNIFKSHYKALPSLVHRMVSQGHLAGNLALPHISWSQCLSGLLMQAYMAPGLLHFTPLPACTVWTELPISASSLRCVLASLGHSCSNN